MALTPDALKAHLNITGTLDAVDNVVLPALLDAARGKVEADLGYALDTLSPVPADLEQAVLMTAAHWYENREASVVGVTAMLLPFGVPDIIANHRRYSFGADDDGE